MAVTGSLTGDDTLNFALATAIVTITETAGTNSLTGSATIGSTITGGSGNDTIVGGSGGDTITAGTGVTANTITGAAGADTITLTGSSGADTIRYNLIATITDAAGANVDTIANFATGTDKINILGGGGAGTTLLGVTLAAGSTAATMGAVVTDTTSVATIANVYTQLAIDLLTTTNAFAGSVTGAAGVVAREVTFTTGAAAGTYLVINDSTASFQAANDIVIKLTGTTTVVAGDITCTA